MTDPQDIHDAVWAKFDAITNLTTYDAVVPQDPPMVGGVVGAYAVLFASPGRLYASALDGAQDSRDATLTVTCAGGDANYVFYAVSKVQGEFYGPITIGGRTYLVRAREDFDPGGIRKDETKTTPRFFIPLECRLHVP